MIGKMTYSEGVCSGDFHAYPKSYAGNPEYAAEYFSHCLCGKKRKVTTVKEVDVNRAGISKEGEEDNE